MPIKSFRPYTPSRRTITVSDYSDITKTSPEKSLTKGLRKTGGRNNTGMIMVRHIGATDVRTDKLILEEKNTAFRLKSCPLNTTRTEAPVFAF